MTGGGERREGPASAAGPDRVLDELTTVVLAPNPSPMTLEGTNTYLLGAPGAGGVVVVDPGPADPAHRRAIEQAARRRDAEPAAVVLTHHHHDHAEAAGWAQAWGVACHAFAPERISTAPARRVRDATTVRAAGVALEAVHTPGHASDHLCLRVHGTDVVLTGDHVLGRGTTVVLWPDGDMAAYLASLERLAALGAAALYPGHGPVVTDPAARIAGYLAHRHAREREILAAVAAGAVTPAAIVTRVYADVDPVLHPAAERSVRAHLRKLADEGRVTEPGLIAVEEPGGTP